MPNHNRMSEAEVSLGLALYLIRNGMVASDVSVATDGAQIKTGDSIHFDIADYLKQNECQMTIGEGWRGTYKVGKHNYGIIIHSTPGQGDVVASLDNNRTLKVESKKGPLITQKGSKEYPLLREAIGQLMTIKVFRE